MQKIEHWFRIFASMGKGFLSGKYTAKDKFEKNDLRTVITRFKEENIKANQPLLELIGKFANEKKCTNAKLLWLGYLKVVILLYLFLV